MNKNCNWLEFDTLKSAEELIRINETYISGDTISGFGMKAKVAALIGDIRSAMFPNIYDTQIHKKEQIIPAAAARLKNAAVLLDCMIAEVLVNRCHLDAENKHECDQCRESAHQITCRYMKRLSHVAQMLHTDIEAAYLGDPAAMSHEEVLLSYPGFEAISIFRLAHELYEMDIPLLPRMMTEYAHSKTGIDINPGATIGKYFFIDHGTGVVIGETCTIGEHVKVYQGVTLGAKSFDLDHDGNPIKGVKRHPNIEDNVIIYAGATILGGTTTIGKSSIIGGNVWLTNSVPAGSTVYHTASAPKIKNGN